MTIMQEPMKHTHWRKHIAELMADILAVNYRDTYDMLCVITFQSQDWLYPLQHTCAMKILDEFGILEAIHIVQEYEEREYGKVETRLYNPISLVESLLTVIGRDVLASLFREAYCVGIKKEACGNPKDNALLINFIKNDCY